MKIDMIYPRSRTGSRYDALRDMLRGIARNLENKLSHLDLDPYIEKVELTFNTPDGEQATLQYIITPVALLHTETRVELRHFGPKLAEAISFSIGPDGTLRYDIEAFHRYEELAYDAIISTLQERHRQIDAHHKALTCIVQDLEPVSHLTTA